MLNLMAVLVITRARWYQGLHLGCCAWDHLNQFGSCGLYCGVNAAEVMVIRLVLKEAISLELNPLIEGALSCTITWDSDSDCYISLEH